MIASLRGTVSEKHADIVIIDCAGVGYGVLVSAADFGGLATGSEAKLYIYEQIKEDAHDLYGFRSLDGKQLFEQLISVKNVGPKVAMSEVGIASPAIIVERKLHKKTNTTMAARILPSIKCV